MRVVVIGGTGHIGSYLSPLLVEAGHEVVCVCRELRRPYLEHPAWKSITLFRVDRIAAEAAGTFGAQMASLKAEVIVDLTCYYPESARQLVEALQGRVDHLLHCGTIWVHGPSVSVPTTEEEPRRPFGDYGIRKAAIEALLLRAAEEKQLPVTVLHPGHLAGPGWIPVNPAGNFNPEIFAALSHGQEVLIPNFGLETVHHVHAKDVARAFLLAIHNREAALGQSFHVVAAAALTLRGYAAQRADGFGQPARLRFLPFGEWKQGVSQRDAAVTEDHIRHSPHCSIAKARTLLGYEPRFSPIEAVQESVSRAIENGMISAALRST